MIDNLPLFHRIAGHPVLVTGEGDGAEAKRRLVERAGGVVLTSFEDALEQGARLAFVAQEDDAAAKADVARARSAGMLVNAMDRPALCDFTVPSILDRSPVLLAIGTGGASAGLAKQVRLRLEAILPQSLGGLASALAKGRAALRQRFPEAGERRRALDSALAAGGALDPLVEGDGEARFAAWLEQAGEGASGSVEIVLRSLDPEDLTLREARLLGTADAVYAEPGVSEAILVRARADAVRHAIAVGEAVAERQGGVAVVLRVPS